MKKSRQRWVLLLLRYGLCLAAIGYLVLVVPWHDYVKLNDADKTRVRLIEERDDALVIERAGHRETIPHDEVHHIETRGQKVPDIELGIANVVLRVNKRWALLSILIFAPVWFIQSYRLVLMVAIQAVRLAYWNAVKLTFAGNFFNFALPGTTGGDLIKAYYLTRYTHLKTEVVTTVFLDRAIGLFGILTLAGGGILLTWNPERFGYLIGMLATIFGGLMVGAIVVFSKRLRHALRLPELAARLPLGPQLLRVGRATVAMRRHKLCVIMSLAITLVLQSIVLISAAVMAWALGMHGSLSYFFIYVAIGFLIAAVPTTPQAIGVMETAYVLFFTQGDMNTASQALALAVAVRLIQLIWAIPGVLVPLLGAHLPSKADLRAIEAQAADDADAAQRTVASKGPTADPVTPSASRK